MLTSSTQLQNMSFHVVERTRTSSKCQKMKYARAKRAKILFFIVKYANLWRSCCRRCRGCVNSRIRKHVRSLMLKQNENCTCKACKKKMFLIVKYANLWRSCRGCLFKIPFKIPFNNPDGQPGCLDLSGGRAVFGYINNLVKTRSRKISGDFIVIISTYCCWTLSAKSQRNRNGTIIT